MSGGRGGGNGGEMWAEVCFPLLFLTERASSTYGVNCICLDTVISKVSKISSAQLLGHRCTVQRSLSSRSCVCNLITWFPFPRPDILYLCCNAPIQPELRSIDGASRGAQFLQLVFAPQSTDMLLAVVRGFPNHKFPMSPWRPCCTIRSCILASGTLLTSHQYNTFYVPTVHTSHSLSAPPYR